jgi:hypothetical protein
MYRMGLLLFSQKLAIGPYTEPADFCLYLHTLFLLLHFKKLPSVYIFVSKLISFVEVLSSAFCVHFFILPVLVTCPSSLFIGELKI